jgi:hypothetical protein
LEHLVGLRLGVGQRRPGQPDPGEVLEAVPQLEQVPAATAQLAGQPGGRRALSDAADDQDQFAGAALGALQGRGGPGVKDAPAGAAVVEDRRAVCAVDRQVAAAAVGAAQPFGVEGVDEEVVAGLLVEQVEQGEVHKEVSRRTGVQLSYPGTPVRKGLTTNLGP